MKIVFASWLLVMSGTASAQSSPSPENTRAACTDHVDNDLDGHVDCDDQDCQDLVFCAGQSPARIAAQTPAVAERRGKATTKMVAGAIMLPLGIVVAGASGGVYWVSKSRDTTTAHELIGAAVAIDVVGVALIAAGAALLAIGAGDLAATAPPKQARLTPSLAIGQSSVVGGFGLTF